MKKHPVSPPRHLFEIAKRVLPCLLLALLITSQAGAQNASHTLLTNLSTSTSPDQIVVKFSPDTPITSRNRTIRKSGGKIVNEIPALGAILLTIPDGEAQAVINYLANQEDVNYVEPNYHMEATEIIPNDPGWSNQYNLSAIRAPAGWSINSGAVWVTIAILDSGIDLSHPDLFVRILPGYDFVNNDNDPQDDNGHGTHVAAIAAASSNNNVGIAGVNWGANIMPIKVLDASAMGTYANLAAGIVWATDHGAQVINLSLGGASPSFVLLDAVNYAYQRGVILVGSTGNAGIPAVLYPAAYDPVIAIGATDINNDWAGFSNHGQEIDLVAPGMNIYSAFTGGGYGYRSGTSMAVPHVSGLAAILIGIPGNGPTGVRRLMEGTALDLGDSGWDAFFGNGLIQMDRAIQLAAQISLPPEQEEQIQQTPSMPQIMDPISTFTPSITPTLNHTVQTAQPLDPLIVEAQTSSWTSADIGFSSVNKAKGDWVGCLGAILVLIGGALFLTLSGRYKFSK
jgi:subtilisin family serine protease